MKISNNTLTVLVLVAIIVSALGMGMTVNLLNKIMQISEITGRTVIGAVNVSLPANTEIVNLVPEVNFGDHQVDATNDTTDDDPYPFWIRNMGNVNVNVSMNLTGPSLWDSPNQASSDLQFKCGDNETTCAEGSQTTWVDWTNGTATLIIANLDFTDTSDENEIEVKIHVPADEPQGDKSAIVEFYSVQA